MPDTMIMSGSMMMVFMFVSMALVLGTLAAGVVWLVRRLRDDRHPGASTADEALGLRHARGEIDRDQYLQRRSDLERRT